MFGDPPDPIKRPQPGKQFAGLATGRNPRWIEPAQLPGIAHPPQGQLKKEACKIDGEDLRGMKRRQAVFLLARPEAQTVARAKAAGPPGPLGRGRLRDPQGGKAAQTARRLEAGAARPAAINDIANPFDCQAGLGDGSGQDDAPPTNGVGAQGEILLGPAEVAKERQHHRVAAALVLPQEAQGFADLARAGKKGEDVAFPLPHHPGDASGKRLGDVPHQRPLQILDLHFMAAPLAADHRNPTEQSGDGGGVKGCRHHQKAQVAPQLAKVEAQGQGEIGMNGALVELVEDDQTDPGQLAALLQPPGEDALGEDLDSCPGREATLVANLVADRLPHRFTEQLGHSTSRHARRQPPWLKDEDRFAGQPRLFQQRQGHQGGLARAGRGREHRRATGQDLAKSVENVHYGQSRQFHKLLLERLTIIGRARRRRPPMEGTEAIRSPFSPRLAQGKFVEKRGQTH